MFLSISPRPIKFFLKKESVVYLISAMQKEKDLFSLTKEKFVDMLGHIENTNFTVI